MNEIEVFQMVAQRAVQAMKLPEKFTGTVQSTTPLKIQIDTTMPPIPAEALILTESVSRKVAEVQGGQGGRVVIHEGLMCGDRVLLLRVSEGQQYIVLSKLT